MNESCIVCLLIVIDAQLLKEKMQSGTTKYGDVEQQKRKAHEEVRRTRCTLTYLFPSSAIMKLGVTLSTHQMLLHFVFHASIGFRD